MSRPLILVTNDDGINAPGVRALVDAATQVGEVVVFAPDSPQSGMGHAITVNRPLRVNQSREHGDIPSWSCDGTPVDCVKLAIYEKLKRKPDLLVSGINHGSNASTNVLYSGTMSAAVEGAMEGIPSIGFSLCDHAYDADFSAAQVYAKKIMEHALQHGIPKGMCLNVNVPKLAFQEIKGIKVCKQADGIWDEEFQEGTDPRGQKYYWLNGVFLNLDEDPDTDINWLAHQYVTIVPSGHDLTNYKAIEPLQFLAEEI
jgi:5'-nucleotidase